MKKANIIAEMVESTASTFGDLLLDSSLIVTTNNKKLYNVKLVDCGDYIQVYYLQDKKLVSKKNDDELSLKKINIESSSKEDSNYIGVELKNIVRSKLECQRLAKIRIWR